MTTKEMEAQLVKMRDQFGGNPTDEQAREYRELWLEWCDAKGLTGPVIDRQRQRAAEDA